MSTCTGLSVSGADSENCNGEYHLVDDQVPWAPDMARKERRDSPSPSGPIGGFYGATVQCGVRPARMDFTPVLV